MLSLYIYTRVIRVGSTTLVEPLLWHLFLRRQKRQSFGTATTELRGIQDQDRKIVLCLVFPGQMLNLYLSASVMLAGPTLVEPFLDICFWDRSVDQLV